MRFPALLTAAVVLAACGAKTDGGEAVPPAPDAMNNMASMGTTHTMQMIESKYEPMEMTIKAGDVVVFKNVSGGMHNVVFYKDSIPAGSEAALAAGIADQADPLSSNLVAEGTDITVSFKDAPAGTYKFYCLPHIGNGMKGTIIVQ